MNNLKLLFRRLSLNFSLKRGRLIKVDERHRGIGKTTILVNHAVKNNIPIAIGTQMEWGYLKSINPNVNLYRLAKNFTIDFKGEVFPNGILIEETVSEEMVDWLKDSEGINIRGGFVKNYRSGN